MMLALTAVFAAAGPELPPELAGGRPRGNGSLAGMHMSDILLVLTAAILVMTALIVWAVFFRKPKADGTRARIHKSRPQEEETEDGMIRKRKRHKRRRRDHRTRNPTLSETGGLPPPRPEGPPNTHL